MSERSEQEFGAATSVLVLETRVLVPETSVSEVGAVSERRIDTATSVLVPETSVSEVEA